MKNIKEYIRDKFWVKAFNTPILQKDRLQWVDYLRGIAIILVVYHHVRVGIERSGIVVPEALVNANMIFYSFRMPLFFIISGIFISRSIARSSVKKLFWIKVENLLYPYLIWSFLQITLQIFMGKFTNSNRSLVDYTYIFYHPRNLDQFWYLPALFNTTAIFLFTKAKLKLRAWQQLTIGLVFYLVSPYFQNISMLSDWMQFYLFFALGDAVSEFFFNPSFQRFLKKSFSLILIIPLFVAAQLFYLQHGVGQKTLDPGLYYSKFDYAYMLNQVVFFFIAIIGCLTILLLAFKMQSWNRLSFLRILGYHSLYIYVMHVILIGFIRLALINFLGVHDPIVLLVAGIAFGVVSPVMIYNLLIKDNVFWFLFSYKKSKKAGYAPRKADKPYMPPPPILTESYQITPHS
jgi:fucose 4-O-acetylase-like acetyltransferase